MTMSYDMAGPTGSWFRHRARDGVLETFYNYERKKEAVMGFIRMAIERAERDHAAGERRFRLLDSFFTTMSFDQIHDMMGDLLELAREDRPIQVLLANP